MRSLSFLCQLPRLLMTVICSATSSMHGRTCDCHNCKPYQHRLYASVSQKVISKNRPTLMNSVVSAVSGMYTSHQRVPSSRGFSRLAPREEDDERAPRGDHQQAEHDDRADQPRSQQVFQLLQSRQRLVVGAVHLLLVRSSQPNDRT